LAARTLGVRVAASLREGQEGHWVAGIGTLEDEGTVVVVLAD
jgi:hypothetical protein